MTKAIKYRRLQFSLRTLLLLVAVAAIGCVTIPPLYRWVFPPKPTFDELIDLITSTVTADGGLQMYDGPLSLEIGSGQEVHDPTTHTQSREDDVTAMSTAFNAEGVAYQSAALGLDLARLSASVTYPGYAIQQKPQSSRFVTQ